MLGLFYEMTLGKINLKYGVPTGIRTPVTAVKGRCPRPLDDRDLLRHHVEWLTPSLCVSAILGI